MKYENMSRFEINKRVVGYLPLMISNGVNSKLPDEVIVNDLINEYAFDGCGNPSDAWPIILMSGISISIDDDNYMYATTNSHEMIEPFGGFYHQSIFTNKDDALRAAMIVFLKINEEAE